jgi:GNAT superfamily N-acetyltransferase
VWVAIYESQVVGFTGLIIEGEGAEIEPFIVSKSHRQKGIGKQLMRRVINEARNKKIRVLNVKPVVRNRQAITFFYKQGFTKLGFVELFIDFSDRPWEQGPELFGYTFDY